MTDREDRRPARRLAGASFAAGALAVAAGFVLTTARLERLLSPDGAFTPLTRGRVEHLRSAVIAGGALLLAAGLLLAWRGPAAVAWARRHGTGLRRLGLAAAGLLVGLLLGELVCRLDEHSHPPPDAGFDYAAYVKGFIADLRARGQLDRQGYREARFDAPREPGVLQVLFLGDSFVYGLGIAEVADTLPARLERELAAAGVKARVLDAGLCGTDTAREITILRELLPRTRPDLVLLGYYPNDVETEALRMEYDAQSRLVPIASDYLLRGSALWRRLEPLAMDGLRAAGMRQGYTARLVDLHAADATAFTAVRQRLTDLEQLARGGGRHFAALLIPMLEELDPYPLEEAHGNLRAHFAERRVPCLDLLDTFRGSDVRVWQVSPLDHHINAAGASRAAQVTAAWLVAGELVQPQGAPTAPR